MVDAGRTRDIHSSAQARSLSQWRTSLIPCFFLGGIFQVATSLSRREEILIHSSSRDHVVRSSPKVLLMRSLLYRMTWPARCVIVETIPDPPNWKGDIHWLEPSETHVDEAIAIASCIRTSSLDSPPDFSVRDRPVSSTAPWNIPESS